MPTSRSYRAIRLFSVALDYIIGSGDGALWRTFTTLSNRPWHADRTVLLGRAAYTAHFSIGLDLRSSLEDAEALARELCSGSGPAEALAAFAMPKTRLSNSCSRCSRIACG